jgi:hypothetical protein
VASEVEALVAALDGLRAGVLDKIAGLTEEDARRSTVGSGTNLAGLVQHLTFVESKWFEQGVGGAKSVHGKRSMSVDESTTLSVLRAEYRAACDRSNAIVRKVAESDAPVKGAGKARDLRSVMLAVIHETARHLGHADIIREQLDGKTGR